MAEEIREEELLRSIDEVDAKIQDFRNRVRALLSAMESSRARPAETRSTPELS